MGDKKEGYENSYYKGKTTPETHTNTTRRPTSLSLDEYLASFLGRDNYGRLHRFAEYADDEPFAVRAVTVLEALNRGHPSKNSQNEASIVLGFVARKGGQEYAQDWYNPHHMQLLMDSAPNREDPHWQMFLIAEHIRTTLEDREIFNPATDNFSWAAIAAFSVLQTQDPFMPPQQIFPKIPQELHRPYFRTDITSSIDRMREVGLLPTQQSTRPPRRAQQPVLKSAPIAS